MALQVMSTDEGIYLARVAFKDPGSCRTIVAHGNKTMWEGGIEDVQHFAADVAAAVMDAVEWTVS